MISGNMVGSYSQIGKTFILVDESGAEITGVVTENVQAFNATPADVRINKTFVSDNGIETGENTITYRTTTGRMLVQSGENFSIPLLDYDEYDYTKFQCIIAPFNTTISDSVAADRISLNDCVYPVASSGKLSDVTKNVDTKSIDLNITNDSENIYFIYYFTYREEY